MSKYEDIFAKGYPPNWFEEVSVIKNLESTVPWTYVIEKLYRKKFVELFYEKEFQRANQTE